MNFGCKCPTCQLVLPVWRLLCLTRWSPVTCPSCGSRLVRRMGLQTALMALTAGIAGVVLARTLLPAPIGAAAKTLLLVLVVVLATIVDLLTVRLVAVQSTDSGGRT